MTELDNSARMRAPVGTLPNETDPAANRNGDGAGVDRLREAIRAAGGVQKVAERSGVPFGSIRHYLAGRDMKGAAIVALADACNVSIEWLLTGRGPMRAGDGPPVQASNTRRILDVDRLSAAIDKALQMLAERGSAMPPVRRFAAIVEVLYSDFSDEEVTQILERLRHEAR